MPAWLDYMSVVAEIGRMNPCGHGGGWRRWMDMEDSEHEPSENGDRELEAQFLAVVRKAIPALRIAKNATKVLRRLSSAGAETTEAALKAGTAWFQLKKARNEYLTNQLSRLPKEQSAIGVKVAERLMDEQHRIDHLVFEAIKTCSILDPLGSS